MTERKEYDAWFAVRFADLDSPEWFRAVGFEFWRAGRKSLIAAAGTPVEIRAAVGGAMKTVVLSVLAAAFGWELGRLGIHADDTAFWLLETLFAGSFLCGAWGRS